MQPDYKKADEIRRLQKLGMNQSQIAKELGVTQTAISSMSRTHNIKWDIGAAARNQTGDKNPNYINGLSKSSIERLTRKIIIENNRSPYLCGRCGDVNKWQEHIRHHRDRDRSNNINSNLEVLCITCHNLEHSHERKRDSKTGRYILDD